jgi:HSP20 family protein
MFYSPAMVRRAAFNHAVNNAFTNQLTGQLTGANASAAGKPSFDLAQDDTSYTFSFDVPGMAKEQLTIGIEGNVVRLESVADAKRQYKAAYELPQDIDVSASEAKLENGVLTLKLAKLVPVNKVTQLPIH